MIIIVLIIAIVMIIEIEITITRRVELAKVELAKWGLGFWSVGFGFSSECRSLGLGVGALKICQNRFGQSRP